MRLRAPFPVVFLQVVVVLVGMAALAVLLWEPQIEGRNAHATQFEIYFKDPFLAYVCVASVPFFVALTQAFKVLSCVARNEVFSPAAVRAVRTIKYCALATIGFVAVGAVFIMIGDSDDRAGGFFMTLIFTFGSAVAASAAAVLERILQSRIDAD